MSAIEIFRQLTANFGGLPEEEQKKSRLSRDF
jgi:hypothetical protein